MMQGDSPPLRPHEVDFTFHTLAAIRFALASNERSRYAAGSFVRQTAWNSLLGKGVSMRRWRVVLLLLMPCLSGCICVCEDGCMDSMRVIEFGSKNPKPTTVAYCQPAAN